MLLIAYMEYRAWCKENQQIALCYGDFLRNMDPIGQQAGYWAGDVWPRKEGDA